MPDDLLSAITETARVELYKTLLRIDNGVRMAVSGGLYDFEPEPSDVMIDERHILLRRYRSKREGGPIHPVPVLIIPPLMVKPDIYDLRPGHSFVEFMLKEGYDVEVDFELSVEEAKSLAEAGFEIPAEVLDTDNEENTETNL